MATIAEFYSANLATEARKGMRQKAKSGGTPHRVPIGYRNIRKRIDGREVATVEIDNDRAPHVRWMFEAYASGDWTIRGIQQELEERGLKTEPTRQRRAKPLSVSNVAQTLRNNYYIGSHVYLICCR